MALKPGLVTKDRSMAESMSVEVERLEKAVRQEGVTAPSAKVWGERRWIQFTSKAKVDQRRRASVPAFQRSWGACCGWGQGFGVTYPLYESLCI